MSIFQKFAINNRAKMKQKPTKVIITKNGTWVASVLIAIALGIALSIPSNSFVNANRANDLNKKIDALEAQISADHQKAEELEHAAESLAGAIAQIDHQISLIDREIELIELKLSDVRARLVQTRADLEKQKLILSEAMKKHYTTGEVRTIELLVESDSFSDFFNQQEYLDRIRSTIQDSAKEIARLEKLLEAQEAEQEQLLKDQQAQRSAQQQIRAGKQQLLNETKGQEAIYRARVAEAEKQRAAVEAELERYIASLVSSGKSLGPVRKGEVVGGVGNTGYSSGPHLHFSVQRNGSWVNPLTMINSHGWAWPVPGYGMTQGYHSGHYAIDIGTQGRYGVPVVAAEDGEIIHKGCLSTGTIYANYAVLIRHSGGYVSRYIHLDPPNSSAYDACRANTYYR